MGESMQHHNDFTIVVARKLMKIGVIIYGGYVRDAKRFHIHEKEFKDRCPELQYEMYNYKLDPPSVHYRKMIYDIDCIMTFKQYKIIMETMNEWGEIKFTFDTKELRYPIEGLDNIPDKLEMKTGKASIKKNIATADRSIAIDAIVVNENMIEDLINRLYNNNDFTCNLFIMMKDKITNDSVYRHMSLRRTNNLEQDDHEKMIANDVFEFNEGKQWSPHFCKRAKKLIMYGWKLGIGQVNNGNELYIKNKLGRFECSLCELEENSATNSIVEIDGLVLHLKCYYNHCRKYVEMVKDNTNSEVQEPILSDNTNSEVQEPILSDNDQEIISPEILSLTNENEIREKHLFIISKEMEIGNVRITKRPIELQINNINRNSDGSTSVAGLYTEIQWIEPVHDVQIELPEERNKVENIISNDISIIEETVYLSGVAVPNDTEFAQDVLRNYESGSLVEFRREIERQTRIREFHLYNYVTNDEKIIKILELFIKYEHYW
jgi:hypothetical protein